MLQTIHSVDISPQLTLPEFNDRRCVGYYDTLEKAIYALTICDLERENYEFCVIEEIPEGVYKDTPNRWLFKREGTCQADYVYVPYNEPAEIKNVRNFGIG